jgi:anti-anti-sigma factor
VPTKSLEITFKECKGCPEIGIVHFKGDLDSDSITEICQMFKSIDKDTYSYLVAEMSEVTLISSAALGELMGCRTHVLERGGDLVMAGLTLKMRGRLTAMDANKIFKFFPDIRSSINAYKWDFRGHAETIELVFPSVMHFVPPVRQLVSRIAKQKGYSNRDTFRIEAIVDEICNNAVEHGVPGGNSTVEIAVTINPKKIEIKVVNTSDPEKIKLLKELSRTLAAPKLVEAQKRGRGLALVRMLSNDLNIDYAEAGTSIHVTKIREE